jgi:hypothetical protein
MSHDVCPHEQFVTTAQVESCVVKRRRRYRLNVSVRCEACGQPFRFLDASFDGTPVSQGGRQLRWELEPAPDRY